MNRQTVLVVGMAVCAASSSAQTFRPLGTAAVVNLGPQLAGPRFASADVTGDGLPDLVLGLTDYRTFEGDEAPDPVFVLASTADGGLVDATAATFCGRAVTGAVNVSGVALGDFDGDGKPDLLVADGGSDTYKDGIPVGPWLGERPKLALSGGACPWTDASGSLAPVPRSFLHSLAVGDVDGDGRTDAYLGAISPPPDGVPYLLMNVGAPGAPLVLDRSRLPQAVFGSWSDVVELGGGEISYSSNSFTGSALADFNRDGRPDLALLADGGTTRGLVFLNDGFGRFDRIPPIPLPDPLYGTGRCFARRTGDGFVFHDGIGTTALEARAADLDGDGLTDLATIETPADLGHGIYYRGGRVHVMLNVGGAGFRTVSPDLGYDASQNYDAYLNLEIADVNGDGLPDLLAYRLGGGFVETHVFANRGGGKFERISLAGLPAGQLWIPMKRAAGGPIRIAAVAILETGALWGNRTNGVLRAQIYELQPDEFRPSQSWVLPSSARVEGIGTFWTTGLTLRNDGTSPATALVKFLGHGGDGRTGPEKTISLAAAETRTFPDVLGSLFGLSSDWGPILVTSRGDLVVQGQTSTPGTAGTYGQSVPAEALSALSGALPRSIAGISEDAAFRTNVMLANATATTTDVDLLLLAPDGAVRSTRRVTLGPLGFAQRNVGTDLGGSGVSGGTLLLSSPTAGASFAAYASAIDRATGDPRTLLSAVAVPSSAWLLPSSARAAGPGTFWTTSLTIHNPGDTAATVFVKFLGHGGDGRGGPEKTVPLGARATVTFPDVLGGLFGLSNDYGPILVRSASPLVVQGQTSTPGTTGTYGQSVPSVPFSDLVLGAARSIPGVSEDSAFRTNLMLAGGIFPTDVDVRLVAPDGRTLASRVARLGPLGFAQLNVGADLGVTGVSGATFVLSTTTPGGAFAAYASAIDRATGDPRTLLPR
jgi:hypothetical protein